MKITGGAVVALGGIGLAAVAVYLLKNKIGALVDIPAKIFNAVNNATPPSMTFDELQSDGTTKKVTVSGQQIKAANANGANMGMVQWPSKPSAVPVEWWQGTGYKLEDWEKDNPFGDFTDIINDGITGGW